MTSASEGTWLITGASSGIGRALAARVLEAGGRVAVTARDSSRIDLDLRGRGVAVDLDLSRPETLGPAVEALTESFGPPDVLVNNAGYGLLGAVEETSDEERREQLEANFFGPTMLTTLLLPAFRARRSGAIVNVSSVSGVKGPPGSAYYAASKHALEGWSESLRAELKAYGVHVLVVEPGPFRTSFFGRSRHLTSRRLDGYDIVDRRRDSEQAMVEQAPGDPDRAAAALLHALAAERPPRRLVLGRRAVETVRTTLQERLAELDEWNEQSLAADFPS